MILKEIMKEKKMGASMDSGLTESKVSIYWKLREREAEFEEIEEAKSLLIDKGFGISDGNYPVFSEVLEGPEYKYNPVVERLRAGERLEDITDKIASQRSNSLRFNKAERVAYNKKVKNLNGIVDASILKSYGALNINEYGGVIGGAIFGGLLGLWIGSGISPHVTSEYISFAKEFFAGIFGGGVMAVIAFSNYESNSSRKESVSRIKEKAKYIDNLLERDRRQIK